jgi:hypothetical protein
MTESATGRGYSEGSRSLTQREAEENERHETRRREEKLHRARLAARPACTCSNSSFGMDVDLCPVHGVGCA